MAKVTIVIEDGGHGADIGITFESEPPLPVREVNDPRWVAELGGGTRDLDIEAATPAQVAARIALGEVLGASRTAELIVRGRGEPF